MTKSGRDYPPIMGGDACWISFLGFSEGIPTRSVSRCPVLLGLISWDELCLVRSAPCGVILRRVEYILSDLVNVGNLVDLNRWIEMCSVQ